MKASCAGCDATWTGLRLEHCTACHQTFSGTSLGDRHRVGPHGPARRCLTVAEMHEKGWRPDRHGVWRNGTWQNRLQEVFAEPLETPNRVPVDTDTGQQS